MTKDSKRSPNSYSDAKLKQRKEEKKTKLTEKLIMGLTDKEIDEESVNIVNKHIICHTPKNEKPTIMEQVLAIQNNLPPNSTSFVKIMLRSHVSGPFWLDLPKQFCVDHLPKFDKKVVLVDENEIEHDTRYLHGDKNGICGGWRSFSIAHKLAEGNVLVFELIEPCKFKVHILRASESESMLIDEDNFQAEPIETGEEEIAEITENSLVQFKDVKCFDDFQIQVDGLILDPDMSEDVRKQYYELCKSQEIFLHENLAKGFSRESAIRVISETVNIANAIRPVTSDVNIFEIYDWTLKVFEDNGMAVGFMRARIDELLRHAVLESKRNELRALETQLTGVRVSVEKLVSEIYHEIKEKDEEFSKIAGAPWTLDE